MVIITRGKPGKPRERNRRTSPSGPVGLFGRPSGDWSPALSAYATQSLIYQISKMAEMCNFPSGILSVSDVFFLCGMTLSDLGVAIGSNEDQSASAEDRMEVSKWVVETAKEYFRREAQSRGLAVGECEGGCGCLVMRDSRGDFFCVSRYDGHRKGKNPRGE